nr:hypothetical protein [Tanacetum cinerariifolium]
MNVEMRSTGGTPLMCELSGLNRSMNACRPSFILLFILWISVGSLAYLFIARILLGTSDSIPRNCLCFSGPDHRTNSLPHHLWFGKTSCTKLAWAIPPAPQQLRKCPDRAEPEPNENCFVNLTQPGKASTQLRHIIPIVTVNG